MISIIVPVYKVEPYLRQCVASILKQTYQNIEVLLIDDGSPDRCGEICDEYEKLDDRVKVFHTENHGLSAARNLGLREAKGEYIGFVDSDDWIEPDMYEVMLKRMRETGADIVTCEYWPKSTETHEEPVFAGTDGLKSLIQGAISNHVWNKLFLGRLFEKVAFPEGRNCEDIADMHLLIEQAQIVAKITVPKYHYRHRSDSISRSYSARNLTDFADAHMTRYNYLRAHYADIFTENQRVVLVSVAKAISRVWRWWYGCDICEKCEYEGRIKELVTFSRRNIPLFGYSEWPLWLKISSCFMHSDAKVSFIFLFLINRFIRAVRISRRTA